MMKMKFAAAALVAMNVVPAFAQSNVAPKTLTDKEKGEIAVLCAASIMWERGVRNDKNYGASAYIHYLDLGQRLLGLEQFNNSLINTVVGFSKPEFIGNTQDPHAETKMKLKIASTADKCVNLYQLSLSR